MTNDRKLELHDRLQVALDIVINIKDDMKIQASRTNKTTQEYRECVFVALKASETAMAVNTLMHSVLLVEEKLAEYLKMEEN